MAEEMSAVENILASKEEPKLVSIEQIQKFLGFKDFITLTKSRPQGGLLNGLQNAVIFLFSMLANVLSGGKATVPEPELAPDQAPHRTDPISEKPMESYTLSPNSTPYVAAKVVNNVRIV